MSTPEKQNKPLDYAATPEQLAAHMKGVLQNPHVVRQNASIKITHGDQGEVIQGTIKNVGPTFFTIMLNDPPTHEMTIKHNTPPTTTFEYEIRDDQGNVTAAGRSGSLRGVEIVSTTTA